LYQAWKTLRFSVRPPPRGMPLIRKKIPRAISPAQRQLDKSGGRNRRYTSSLRLG
jgi:hypothetical protein